MQVPAHAHSGSGRQLPALIFFITGAVALAFGQNPPPRDAPGPSASISQAEGTAEVHLGRGYDDLRTDRYGDAVVEFRAALAIDPGLVLRARFPLAVALFESQKLDESRREFEAVRRSAGDRPDLMYYLGRMDLSQGNLEAAIRELSKAAAEPPLPDAAYYLGSAYLRQDKLEPAARWLHQAEVQAPHDSHVEERIAALYRQQGRTADADKAMARAAELRGHDAEIDRQRMSCAQSLENGSLEAARPVCELLFDPSDPQRLTVLGTIYGQHGDFEEALRPFRRAAELSPSSPQMQYNLALVCFRLKRYDEAKAALLNAVKEWPDLFQLNSLLGVVLYRLGDVPGAYDTLNHAHALNPQDRDTGAFLYEVSLVLAEKRAADKDYEPALACLKTASGIRSQDPEPHARMADVYAAMGQPDRAQEERQKAEQLHTSTDSK